MSGSYETAGHLQDTQRIHHPWKSRMHIFIRSPFPWSKINRQETNETGPPRESLETLLCHKRGRMAFRDFLKSEFCEENLDFWLACQEFKAFESPEELTQGAARIYEDFISADSPKQVNIDFYTRDTISRSLQQPSPSCFLGAQGKIYNLMANGSFPRFILSEKYKVLLAAASNQKSLVKNRKALRIKSHDSKPIVLLSDLYLSQKDIVHDDGGNGDTETQTTERLFPDIVSAM